MNILLVEDDPADRLCLERALGEVDGFRHRLSCAGSLEEAARLAREQPFDLVLLDLSLPDARGIDAFERAAREMPGLPIVVATSNGDAPLASQALQRGAQDYLPKGQLPGEAIARVLRYAIDRHRFLQTLEQQNEELRLLTNHLPAILWTTDASLRITSSRGAGLRALSLNPGETDGMTIADYLADDPEIADQVSDRHREAMSTGPTAFQARWMGREFAIQIAPLRQGSQTVGTVGVAVDVTEQRQEAIQREAAWAVQRSLLPVASPVVPGLDVAACSIPAGKMCGDWYDFLSPRSDTLDVIVGDVSGHGLPAALLACACSARIAALASSDKGIPQILGELNASLYLRTRPEDFVILMFLRIDAVRRLLTYAGSGDQILLLSGDGRSLCTLNASGMPLALAPEAAYEAPGVARLAPGDVILALTDGFREARNVSNELFGNRRILEVAARHAGRTAEEILTEVRRAVVDFIGPAPQHDDMTGVVIRVL